MKNIYEMMRLRIRTSATPVVIRRSGTPLVLAQPSELQLHANLSKKNRENYKTVGSIQYWKHAHVYSIIPEKMIEIYYY